MFYVVKSWLVGERAQNVRRKQWERERETVGWREAAELYVQHGVRDNGDECSVSQFNTISATNSRR